MTCDTDSLGVWFRLAWQALLLSYMAASPFCSFLFKRIYFILREQAFYSHKYMCIFCVPGSLDPLELNLRMTVNTIWVLGTESGSSARSTRALSTETPLRLPFLFSLDTGPKLKQACGLDRCGSTHLYPHNCRRQKKSIIVYSRTARATWWDPVSRHQQILGASTCPKQLQTHFAEPSAVLT